MDYLTHTSVLKMYKLPMSINYTNCTTSTIIIETVIVAVVVQWNTIRYEGNIKKSYIYYTYSSIVISGESNSSCQAGCFCFVLCTNENLIDWLMLQVMSCGPRTDIIAVTKKLKAAISHGHKVDACTIVKWHIVHDTIFY